MSQSESAAKPSYISILGSIRPYDRSWLTKDIVAGITLAALAIPEVMGYTKIAGTPVITGLYTILLPVLAFAALRLVPSPRRRRRLGDRRDHVRGHRRRSASPASSPSTPEWVALAGLSALITAVPCCCSLVSRGSASSPTSSRAPC